MVARVIVEVLGVRGRARLRVPLDTLPATVGRALDCDVIVDDPRISGQHARLERDAEGRLWLVDLGSRNGTVRLPDNARVTRTPLEHDTRFRLGNTVVRVRLSSEPIERTVVAHVLSPPLVSLVMRKWVVLLLLSAVAAWSALSAYLGDASREVLANVVRNALGLPLVLVAWAATWAVVSRMVVGRFRFNGHLASAAIAVLCMEVWDYACTVGCYAFAVEPRAPSLTMTGDVAVAIWLLYMHLRLATFQPPRRLLRIASVLVLTGALVGQVLQRLDRPGFSPAIDAPRGLWPPAFHLRAPSSVDAFLQEVNAVRARADALAAEQ